MLSEILILFKRLKTYFVSPEEKKKLANKGFTDKAPAHLVEEERAKGEKYKEMLETVVARLESLK